MRKLEIRNFGPILSLGMDLKDVNILIGPQASGKSTVAKLDYFFHMVPKLLFAAIKTDFQKGEDENSLFKSACNRVFSEMFGPLDLSPELYAAYIFDCPFSKNKEKIGIRAIKTKQGRVRYGMVYSKGLSEVINELRQEYIEKRKNDDIESTFNSSVNEFMEGISSGAGNDGCAVRGSETPACDFIVVRCAHNAVCLIELKGCDLERPYKQIAATFATLPDLGLSDCKVSAIIVVSRTPSISYRSSTRTSLEKKLRETGGSLTSGTRECRTTWS